MSEDKNLLAWHFDESINNLPAWSPLKVIKFFEPYEPRGIYDNPRCQKYPRHFVRILRWSGATQTKTSFVTFATQLKMEAHVFPFFPFVSSPMDESRVARETFPETPEVMSHVYQLWRHIYTTNDVTAFPETFPTQLWYYPIPIPQ